MVVVVVVQSSPTLLCPPNSISSAAKTSSHSRRLHIPFQNPWPASNPSSSFTPLLFNSLQGEPRGLIAPPVCSTATKEIVETSDGHLEFVEIGYISDVHGLQGEIRVKYNTDFPDLRFAKPGKRWLRQRFSGRQEVLEVELLAGRNHPGDKSWIVKLSGFDSIDEAKQLVGATFLVREADRPELEEGEYYSRDLVGVRVILKDTGEAVGTVVNIFSNGGNDLLHVLLDSSTESPSGGENQKSEISESSGQLVWIPFVEAIVPDVDLDRREMQITPPKGLLQLNLRSDERSKKERRILEWRERKKFQRRLIAAKKKLCELEQQHIFHGFRYGEKSQRSLLTEQIVSVNSSLLQQALQAIKVPVNGYNVRSSMLDAITWKYTTSLKISGQHLTSIGKENPDGYSKHTETGRHLLSEGKVATVLVLSSGKLERISETDLVDSESGENSTIILTETLLSDTQRFAEQRASVPVIFISPAHNVQPLEQLFASHDYFGFNSEKVRFLEEEKLPVVSCSAEEKNKVLMKSPWVVLQSPIGSGGMISALSSNNILEYLFESGVEYVELCSLNKRCLCGNPTFLGFVDSCKADIGILTFEDTNELEDNFHILLPVKSMNELVKQIEKLPFQAILKCNSHVELINKEWVDVIPSTPNSYEFRCSLESLLNACLLEKACMMEVTG